MCCTVKWGLITQVKGSHMKQKIRITVCARLACILKYSSVLHCAIWAFM
jgi:hypothetical protein